MKKRVISFTIIFLMLFTLMGNYQVVADENYDVEVDTYKEYYDMMKYAMESLEEKISIKINNYQEGVYSFNKTIEKIINENPEIYYNYGGATAGMRSYYSYQTYRVYDIYFRYRGDKDELKDLVEVKNYIEFKKAIVSSLDSFDDRMLIKIYDYDSEKYNIDKAIDTVLSEVPDLDYGILGWSIRKYGEGKDKLIEVHISYSFSKTKMKEMKEAVDKKAREIINSIIKPDMSDFEKELALHDYVLNNANYNSAYETGTILPEDEHTAYGVLVKGQGVCSSYAKAMHKLLSMVGIESYFVVGTGNGEAHAWNIAKIQGNYYHLDATWDDTIDNGYGDPNHEYFNLTDNQMSIDHIWDSADYPNCTSTLFSYENISKILSGEITFISPEDSVGSKTVLELPNNTVIIGERAFDINFANSPDNSAIINDVLYKEPSIRMFVKINDKWFNIDGSDARLEDIPTVSYTKDGFNYTKYNAIDKDVMGIDKSDKITFDIDKLVAGSKISVDIKVKGIKDYPTVKKFSVVGTDEVAELGTKIFVFPSIKIGDRVQVQLYTENNDLVDTLNLVIHQEIEAPTNLTAVAIGDSEIELNWERVEEADYYYVYQAKSIDGPFEPIKDENGKLKKHYWFSDYCVRIGDVLPETTLYFKVVAVKDDVQSDFSDVVSATTLSSRAKRSMEIVQNGNFYEHPDITIKEAFENYFINPKWKYFESTDGYNIVEFKGDCYYNNELVDILIQFTIELDDNTFFVNYREKNGEVMQNDVFLDLLNSVYDN